ncbi:hypothetical protein P167DRAFT_566213 [Morchella conica CCBAS932]|uniref:Secreted protein n=1 Tax=Morchella conica CCBAS932 TaxID=1392247 RepID=A0A3N4KKQ1_9PEZI|nr:hypothetical protein P167DRAFT_566213 [Morchella conica CCBAS932]
MISPCMFTVFFSVLHGGSGALAMQVDLTHEINRGRIVDAYNQRSTVIMKAYVNTNASRLNCSPLITPRLQPHSKLPQSKEFGDESLCVKIILATVTGCLTRAAKPQTETVFHIISLWDRSRSVMITMSL